MKSFLLFWSLLAGVALAAPESAGNVAPEARGRQVPNNWVGRSFRDVPYKQVDGRNLLLDIYLPADQKAAGAPLIYYVHGGGWAAGSKEKFGDALMLPVFRRLADRGFVCVAVGYRLPHHSDKR